VPSMATHHITNVKTSLCYLGVYIVPKLTWDTHIDLMVNCACSTIRDISILGNSIRGLDFINWWRVYNALVIPTLTYGAQVLYTGVQQKRLLNHLQITQNEGLCKMTGVFRTTPTEPLHNLARIPPIPYLMKKLMHSYAHRLWDLPSSVKVCTILTSNLCQYWPEYVNPITNLSRPSINLREAIPRAPVPCTVGTWTHPHFTHLPNPPLHTVMRYKESMVHQEAADTHIFITHHIILHHHLATYHITRSHHTLLQGITHRQDQTQAIHQAVTATLTSTIPTLYPSYIIIWLSNKSTCNCELTHLSSYSNPSEIHTLIDTHLQTAKYHTIHLCNFDRKWPRAPSRVKLWNMELEQHVAQPLDPMMADPKHTMWGLIHADYQPNPHPSFITCDSPLDNISPLPSKPQQRHVVTSSPLQSFTGQQTTLSTPTTLTTSVRAPMTQPFAHTLTYPTPSLTRHTHTASLGTQRNTSYSIAPTTPTHITPTFEASPLSGPYSSLKRILHDSVHSPP
jgi:hypothetical protein